MSYAFKYGSGTPEDPFQIWTPEDLNGVRDYLDAYFVQMADIDLSGYANWSPIGTPGAPFTGSYEGNYRRISGLKIVATSSQTLYLGLFGCVGAGGFVLRVKILGAYVEGHGPCVYAGVVAGQNQGTIQQAYCEGTVTATNTTADSNRLGGVVGCNAGGEVYQCKARVDVLGELDSPAPAQNGNICGGVVGENLAAGGVGGCCAFGSVVAKSTDQIPIAGGLVGRNLGYGVEASYAFGSVHVQCSPSGGLAGGLIGEVLDGSVRFCYSVGCVSADSVSATLGGLIGAYYSELLLLYSYYNTETSGQSDTGKGEPRTTSEMTYPHAPNTYEGWDFDYSWAIAPDKNSSYPYLTWEEQLGEEPEATAAEQVPNYPPATYIQLRFRSGNATPYPMGIFYQDRSEYKVGDGVTRIEVRNVIGKYLKDQTFDERNTYPEQNLKTLIEGILACAGVTRFEVAETTTRAGIQFSPSTPILDGLLELLKLEPGWEIYERIEDDGSTTVVVGPRPQGGKYTFTRGRDVFSREVVRDDGSAYSRVCVHDSSFKVRVYRQVGNDLGWLPPVQKTLYVQAPDGITESEAAVLADAIAGSIKNSGEVETFVGPFRPYLQPGDLAEIVDPEGPRLLGVITEVRHTFGKDGFYTEFVVDSGGAVGRQRISDYVNRLARRAATAAPRKL